MEIFHCKHQKDTKKIMRNITSYLLFFILFLGKPAFSQNEKTATSSVKTVTLYLQGAQVFREASANLEQGTNTIVIPSLSNNIQENSIQLSVEDKDVKIQYVSQREKEITSTGRRAVMKLLEDSIDIVKNNLELELINYAVLQEEESLLKENKKMAGDKGVLVPELEDALQLYRIQLPEIKKKILQSTYTQKKILLILKDLQDRYEEFKKGSQEGNKQIVVGIYSPNKRRITINFSYTVRNAYWIPVYNLRGTNISEPVLLDYKANIVQNAGEAWNNVLFKLSSGNPDLSGNLPELNASYLNLLDNIKEVKIKQKMTLTDKKDYEEIKVAYDIVDEAPLNYNVNLISNTTNFSFDIPYLISLYSDGKEQLIDIKTDTLKTEYQYQVIPKLNNDVFLNAKITQWENLNLISGEANIIFDGAFLGTTYIDASNPDDTLEIGMGREKRIITERKTVKELSSKGVFGSKKKEEKMFEINIKNNKTEAVTIIVNDQIPVVQNKDIDLEVLELNGAEYNKETGKLTWKISLESGQSKTIRFGYKLSYPKNFNLVERNY